MVPDLNVHPSTHAAALLWGEKKKSNVNAHLWLCIQDWKLYLISELRLNEVLRIMNIFLQKFDS